MAAQTIFALSSGSGRSGVAVIRLSGPDTRSVLQNLTGSVPEPRKANLCAIRSAQDNTEIDRALVLFFPAPHSFTGEDVAEFQVHGSPAVVRRLLEELSTDESCELAAPGAFTERAFLNGKLDLTEVEGLADLIAADTELQRTQALAQSSGILRKKSTAWRRALIHALALIEAVLDFSDEGDVTEGPIAEAHTAVRELVASIHAALSDTARAETIRNGMKVAIVGAPNAGKSSLLNILAARDVAIVTPEAGTTRDTIEVQLELAGLPVTLIDTAGLRETDNAIEREGIARARIAAKDADLVIHIVDAAAPDAIHFESDDVLIVLNKVDLLATDPVAHNPASICISAKTGAGIDHLIQKLTDWCKASVSNVEPAIVTRARQRQCLVRCLSALEYFQDADLSDLELRAEDLRTAAVALGQLTGEIGAEDVLDDIFAGFCIGK